MNHIFKVVWNDALQAWQAISETCDGARKKGKSQRQRRALRLSMLAMIASLSGYTLAQMPTGGAITAGSGAIAVNGNTMTINQSTPRMVTDWQSFSIGAGKTVEFIQPSSSAAALNRVLGADVSTIQGAIRANGQVLLLNPNGVLFTPTAQVNVGGLIASTLNLSNADFMAGKLNFEGTSANAIVNQGALRAGPGGTVALVAARIVNEPGASVVADGGQVLMGAGSKVTLDLGGPVRIKVEQGALQALIDQGGAVQADGGLIYMTAQSAEALGRTVINHTGVSRAQTAVTGESGAIYLMGGMDKDSVQVAGTLDASAPQAGNGGFIETSAAQVNVAAGAQITTAAANGQTGQWLIDPYDFTVRSSGGNITGADLSTLLNSNSVTIQTATGTDTSTNKYTSTSGNGDITVLDNIIKSSGSATTLTLLADRNIVIGSASQAVSISGSAGSPLSLLMSARATGAASGHVELVKATIKTFGGNVTIGGGDATATDYAIAQSAANLPVGNQTGGDQGAAGVRMRDSSIDASSDGAAVRTSSFTDWLGSHSYLTAGSSSGSGGNITIRGQGAVSPLTGANIGIWLYAGSSMTTAGAGTISLDGTGGNAAQTYGRIGSTGVALEGRSALMAQSGDISLNGRAGSGYGAFGVAFTEGGGVIKTGGKLLINAADGTASKNDNAVLIRDGQMTFDVGDASEISAPLVGGTSNVSIKNSYFNQRIFKYYSFTTKGLGSFTLAGDAKAWNSASPANTFADPSMIGGFDVEGGDLLLGTGLGMAQAMYFFWKPPTTTFQFGIGAIGSNGAAPSAGEAPVRISSRELKIARGELPENPTPEEQAQLENFKNARQQAILLGISPPNATNEEMQQAYLNGRRIQETLHRGYLPPGVPQNPELMAKLTARRAEMIAIGRVPAGMPVAPDLTAAEKILLKKAQQKRADMIAQGIAPAEMAYGEWFAVGRARDKLIAEGQTPPNASPVEQARAQKARQDMIAKGVAPKDATPAEKQAVTRAKINNFFRGLFRR